MLSKNPQRIIIAIIAVVVIILTAAGYFIWKKYKAQPAAPAAPKIEESGLGSQLYEEIKSPTENIPETNPFEAKTNPFEEAKTNPFKDIYKNPFE